MNHDRQRAERGRRLRAGDRREKVGSLILANVAHLQASYGLDDSEMAELLYDLAWLYQADEEAQELWDAELEGQRFGLADAGEGGAS